MTSYCGVITTQSLIFYGKNYYFFWQLLPISLLHLLGIKIFKISFPRPKLAKTRREIADDREIFGEGMGLISGTCALFLCHYDSVPHHIA
jgi:hypothetical protein